MESNPSAWGRKSVNDFLIDFLIRFSSGVLALWWQSVQFRAT